MRHRARKRFGQNFLQDTHIIHKIMQSIQAQTNDNVLEIGPGLGALTKELLKRVKHLTAIEIDRDLSAHLRGLWSQEALCLIGADALSVDYSQFGSDLRVVGNLPYNIATPLLLRLLEFTPFIKDMYFMLQKEVVERMASPEGSKAYGRLSVMLQYHCEVNYLFTVPRNAFLPEPKVDSAMVQLIPHTSSPFEKVFPKQLERLVAKAFSMRRKTLINNLKEWISIEQLQALGIDKHQRPEQISVAEYVQLAKFIFK